MNGTYSISEMIFYNGLEYGQKKVTADNLTVISYQTDGDENIRG